MTGLPMSFIINSKNEEVKGGIGGMKSKKYSVTQGVGGVKIK